MPAEKTSSNTWADAARGYCPAVLRLRHAARLAGELVGFAFVNRLWWLLPMVLVLAVASLVIVVGQAAAPVTLYPMF